MKARSFFLRSIVVVCVVGWTEAAFFGQIGPENRPVFNVEEEKKNELNAITLNCYFNPYKNFLAGTALMQFEEPSRTKSFTLDGGLAIRSIRTSPKQKIDFLKENKRFFLIGKEIESVQLYYYGTVEPSVETDDLAQMPQRSHPREIDLDQFYFLFRHQDFYPNASGHFMKSRITLNVPAGLNCLASGSLVEAVNHSDTAAFTFESPMTKGISLVCGNFKRIARIPGPVPLNIFASKNFDFNFYFKERELKDITVFLTRLFGRLDLPEINILFRRARSFGGVSHTGFIVYDIDAAYSNFNPDAWKIIRSDGPLTLHDIKKDNMVHEMAHQWWGGVAACQSNGGIWITEGLSQFATLLYLEQNLNRAQFEQVIQWMKKWIEMKTSVGTATDGQNIVHLKHDPEAYQAIVYNKSALVMMMLREILGEATLLERIRSFLQEYKYRSVTSKEFIEHMSQNDEMLRRFFRCWIQQCEIPGLSYQVQFKGHTAEITAEQTAGASVFPVTVTAITAKGKTTRTWVIQEKKQAICINLPSEVVSVRVDSPFGPVKIQKTDTDPFRAL